MAEKEMQVPFYQLDINNRIRDLEEKNKILKERILLIGKNLINIKDETEKEIIMLKSQIRNFQQDIEKIKNILQSLLSETDKFARKSEIYIIERMLKDFQPLEFLREKDIEEMLEQKLKTIKPLK